ncbi:MAG: hypothetical protein ABI162_10085 [Luteolibacter sp.]
MNDSDRLSLIVEAVKYCQKVKQMKMPPSCYSKALREPIFFLWELRIAKNKLKAAGYRSKAAVGMNAGGGKLIYDHSVLFSYLQDELLDLESVTIESVREILERHGTACLITWDEDRALSKAGLGRRMPPDWDRKDPLARYRALKIEILPNCDSGETSSEPSSEDAHTDQAIARPEASNW